MTVPSNHTEALSSSRLRLRLSKGGYNACASTMDVLRLSSALGALMAQDCGETSMANCG
ncbi:hypothetical protein [Sphingorhabdus sp.]|jgi:hypothetical protein|uniref:hypothetical protein n=1 Tax=Sphingorhabdus sp. TaxID=1902408 RepID=UPI0037C74ED8